MTNGGSNASHRGGLMFANKVLGRPNYGTLSTQFFPDGRALKIRNWNRTIGNTEWICGRVPSFHKNFVFHTLACIYVALMSSVHETGGLQAYIRDSTQRMYMFAKHNFKLLYSVFYRRPWSLTDPHGRKQNLNIVLWSNSVTTLWFWNLWFAACISFSPIWTLMHWRPYLTKSWKSFNYAEMSGSKFAGNFQASTKTWVEYTHPLPVAWNIFWKTNPTDLQLCNGHEFKT